MWNEALAGIQTHLITTTRASALKIVAELPQGIGGPLSPKMDHLVCFLPGAIALGATGGHTLSHARTQPEWTPAKESQIQLGRDLMKTCWAMYAVTLTGLAPEIAWFDAAEEDLRPRPGDRVPLKRTRDSLGKWREDFVIKPLDAHNLQRPETVESLFVMWRVTGDTLYREWGWKIFRGFMEWTNAGLDRGFASVGDVNAVPPPLRDNMESFWLVSSLVVLVLVVLPVLLVLPVLPVLLVSMRRLCPDWTDWLTDCGCAGRDA